MAAAAPELLSRTQFRERVLTRDGRRCVFCGTLERDRPLSAHHIIERRLWPDGGYYEINGATLCDYGEPSDGPDGAGCHLRAEMTELSVEVVRRAAGINEILLPEQFLPSDRIDKWGNLILDDGRRSPGPLFDDPSVRAILAAGGMLDLFDRRVRYPRTFHHPASPGGGDDDRYLRDVSAFEGHEVVVTAKLDGESTTMMSDCVYARSPDSKYHPTRTRVTALHGQVAHLIPDRWRVCGENLQGLHAIAYRDLPSPFFVFAVYDERNVALSWDDTVEVANMLGLPLAPVLYRGVFDESAILSLVDTPPPWADQAEGLVCRFAGEIAYRDWCASSFKWVRPDHTRPHDQHWMNRTDVPENGFRAPASMI